MEQKSDDRDNPHPPPKHSVQMIEGMGEAVEVEYSKPYPDDSDSIMIGRHNLQSEMAPCRGPRPSNGQIPQTTRGKPRDSDFVVVCNLSIKNFIQIL